MKATSFFGGRTDAPMMKRKIGIFGGTFNPPHIGHLFMAEQAYYECLRDRVVLLPLGDPPHKRGAEILPSDVRLKMLDAMTERSPFLEVSRMETERGGYTYTVETLEQLSRTQGEEYYYIIGADTLFELENWRRFRDVVKLTEFICFMRRGIDRNAVIEKIWQIRDEFGKEVLLSKTVAPGISSTEIRERIRNGEPLKGLVTEAVGKILEEENAFR